MRKQVKFKNGTITFKAQNNSDSAELIFYGDICMDVYSKWSSTDRCPVDVANLLSNLDDYKSVNIHINSGGGDAFGGIAIYNLLKSYAGHKTVYIDGLAASAASIIAMAGDKIIMPTSAQLMIHSPSACCYGNADDMRKLADALDNCEESILNVYYENLADGVSKETIAEMVAAETWLTAEKAQQYFKNIEVEHRSINLQNCSSQFYNFYKNTPQESENINLIEELKKLLIIY